MEEFLLYSFLLLLVHGRDNLYIASKDHTP
jgi:hypothetical protein